MDPVQSWVAIPAADPPDNITHEALSRSIRAMRSDVGSK
jgi:hypothetical protein